MYDNIIFKELLMSMIKSLGGSVSKDYILEDWFYSIVNKLNLDYFESTFKNLVSELVDEDRLCDYGEFLIVTNDKPHTEHELDDYIIRGVFPNYPNVGCTLQDVDKEYMLTFETFNVKPGLCQLYALALVMDKSFTFKQCIRTVDLRNVVSEFGSFFNENNKAFFLTNSAVCDYDTIACIYVLYSSGTMKFKNGDVVFDFSNVATEYFATFNTAYIIANLDLYDEYGDVFVNAVNERVQQYAKLTCPKVEFGHMNKIGNEDLSIRILALLASSYNFGERRVKRETVEKHLMQIAEFEFKDRSLFKQATAHIIEKNAKQLTITNRTKQILARLLVENSVK